MNISQDDLLEALRAAMAPTEADGEGFRTVVELAGTTRKTDDRIRKALRILMGEGRLETRPVKRPGIDGRMIQVPAYRIKPAA